MKVATDSYKPSTRVRRRINHNAPNQKWLGAILTLTRKFLVCLFVCLFVQITRTSRVEPECVTERSSYWGKEVKLVSFCRWQH